MLEPLSPRELVMAKEEYSCGRRFARRVNSDEWLNLVEAHTVSDQEIHDRLESNWTAVASVSALVTGFTYVATNSDVTYTITDGPLSEHRVDLFGFFSMLSFGFALQATIYSAGLFGIINIMGVESVNWFVRKNWWLIDLPLMFCFTSIGLMLVSALVSIGGIVDRWAYYFLLAFSVVSGLFFGVIFFRVQRQMYARTVMLKAKQHAKDSKKNDDLELESAAINTNDQRSTPTL